MKFRTLHQLFMAVYVTTLTLAATSCASLQGNPNCHCGMGASCSFRPTSTAIVNGHTMTVAQDDRPANPELAAILATDPDELYAIKKYVPDAPQRLVWIEDPVAETVDELTPYINISSGRYMPRTASMSNTTNDIFFYFDEGSDGRPDPLRLHIQYYADDPLKFYEVVFWVDGFDYHFKPSNKTEGKGKKPMIWECSDDPLTTADKDLVYAVSHGESVKVNFLGGNKGINHIKTLTEDQINDLYVILQLYRLKGGTFK